MRSIEPRICVEIFQELTGKQPAGKMAGRCCVPGERPSESAYLSIENSPPPAVVAESVWKKLAGSLEIRGQAVIPTRGLVAALAAVTKGVDPAPGT